MPIPPPPTYEAPVIGTDGNDFLTVEDSISFTWVPDPGNAYTAGFSAPDLESGTWTSTETTGPSSASGYVTFNGVTSDEPFTMAPQKVDFSFTNGNAVSLSGELPYSNSSVWTYDRQPASLTRITCS